ncbi:MAG: mechanosensitive ion channel family protein [Clostridiales bacterium]|nr:mechanosensitive ion channel family protein [Clostridiales bacterium]
MKRKGKAIKRVIIIILLAVVLAVLLFPDYNPLLSESGKAAANAQIQSTFGALFTGSGMLTPANLMAAAAALIMVYLATTLFCGILSLFAKRSNRSKSVAELFISIAKCVGAIVGIVWALSAVGVNLTGIFASLGILSLIVGFGAQSLIEDAITGIFIIFEGQYQVGDIIVLDGFRGTVENIGIRTTTIKDTGGNLKVINNSDIRNLQNRSRNASLVVSEIGMRYEDRIEDVEKVLIPALQDIYERNKDIYLAPPRYVGVEALADSAVVLRVVADVTEENIFVGRRTLNRELKILFDNNNIEVPFPQVVVHRGE